MATSSEARHAHGGHARHDYRCDCGRNVSGNGRKVHFRACRTYLEIHGWPLNDGMTEALRQDGLRAAEIGRVERKLAIWALEHSAPTGPVNQPGNLPWREFRTLVWHCADLVRGEL